MTSSTRALTVERLSQAGVSRLRGLLDALESAGDAAWFRPHPSDGATLGNLCNPAKEDLHYLLGDETSALGYGLLRGWDEGFETPSLGLAIHPAWRGFGFGVTLMHFLHAAARLRGATRVRLRVHASNAVAIDMYRKFGYAMAVEDGRGTGKSMLVGYKELRS